MAPRVSLLYILFTVGFLSEYSTSNPQLELGLDFLEEPKDVIGVKGRPLTLPCAPSKQQKDSVEVKWYHDDKLMDLTNDRRRTVFPNGTLHFSKLVHKRAGHSDQGEYRCVIAKENGSLSSRPGFLRISALPESFSRHPEGQDVEIGSNVRLSCEIDLYPEVEIEWGKDDEKLPQNLLKYATVTGPDVHGSVLYIFNAVPDDSGSYRCTAKNTLLNKQRHSSSGLLTVLPRTGGPSHSSLTFLSAQPPLSSPSFFASVREIKEGDSVTLDCVANGSPTPILTWHFLPYGGNGPRPAVNRTSAGHNMLEIKNVTRRHAGWYTCSAMNSSKKETTTEVKVLTRPEIQEKSENIAFRASKTIRFRCSASGIPVPEISWMKDGSPFNITGRIKHRTSVNESQQLRLSELVLTSTVTSDAGIYQCMADNSVGSTWAAVRLSLNATRPAPGPPEKVSCEPLSSSQIKISWDVPKTPEKIIAFSVHYHLTENGEEMPRVVASENRSKEIDKLLPYTNYTFYVRLYISDSASDFSEKTVCQTGEEVPVEAPRTELKIVSPNSMHVTWLPLPKEKARGFINRYKIQWRIKGSPSSRVEEVTGDVLDYTITGLVPGKEYDVRVLPGTRKGWPESDLPWETLEVPLKYNQNLPSAPEVKLQAINSTSIEVRWSLPDRGTEVDGFKIFYRKHNSNRLGPIRVPADAKTHVITGLDPETWYEVMVLGVTNIEDGEIGTNSVHTLSKEGSSNQLSLDLPLILEPPSSLEAEPVSPTVISLSWSSSEVASGTNIIKYYTVCFNPVQTSRSKKAAITCLKSSENKILITDLNPFTLYEFKVRSHDVNDRESPYSQTVECHTLEDVPSAVMDIGWKALNKTTIQATWREPRHSNGIIKNYTIFYTQDSSLPLSSWNVKVVPASDFKTQLTDLTSNVKYFLIIRAATSAGLGSYGTPKQVVISSPIGVSGDEPAPKTPKDKQSDHYIGIMVGLGIGMCCIILCSTCILCRRRCLKRHISQEFEVTTSRHNGGNDCRRDREIVMESREPEYFTFLSSQRDRINATEVPVPHQDTTSYYPNGSANGIRMSLLSEGRTSNDSGKANISITENPRFDPNCSESPLLSPRTYSNSSSRSSDTVGHYKLMEGRRGSSRSGRGKNLDSKPSENQRKEKDTTPSEAGESPRNMAEKNEVERLSEDETWSNLNSVLKNPEFRFSESNPEKVGKTKNGFVALPGYFYNATIELNGFGKKNQARGAEDARNRQMNGIYTTPKLSLQVLSKEITQES